MLERTIAVTTHGRYLVAPGSSSAMLVGFHGYMEAAETQMERLRASDGVERWTIVSIQGLHRFYQRRSNDVIAGWMTKQDRELAIADNLAYVTGVIDAESPAPGAAIVYAGFSQGVAMAFRAAAASARAVAGVVAVGGDVPPELDRTSLARLRAVLLCRGAADDWYTSQKFGDDCARLEAAGVALAPFEFSGGHEWSAPVQRAVAQFLAERLR